MSTYRFKSTQKSNPKEVIGGGIFRLDRNGKLEQFHYRDVDVKRFDTADIKEFTFIKDQYFSFWADGDGCGMTTAFATPSTPAPVSSHGCGGDQDLDVLVYFPMEV